MDIFEKVIDLNGSDELNDPCKSFEEQKEREKETFWQMKALVAQICYHLMTGAARKDFEQHVQQNMEAYLLSGGRSLE